MTLRPLLIAVACGIGLSALVASAEQSLAELSRNAEASRNTTPGTPPVKVYSNKDLPDLAHLPPPTASTNSSAQAPAAPSAAPSTPSAESPGTRDEAYWRDRMRPLRERLNSARTLADDTKRRAESLMRAADKCFSVGVVCADYTESLRLTEEHKRLAADVAYAEREVAALEEEGRRAGVPPGWLR